MGLIKGMMGLVVAMPIAGAAMGAMGSMGAGIGSATQSLVSIGIMGKAAGIAKKAFKW